MSKVTKNFVIISLPNSGPEFKFSFKLPLIKEKTVLFKIPIYNNHKFDGLHYWEIGKKGYQLNKILEIMSKFFEIEERYLVPENPYHMLFVLKVKK